jgi:organic radical activating enzyme
MSDLANLSAGLTLAGLRTHIETSGAYPVTGMWDWICFSPKKFKTPHNSILAIANELKVIVYNSSDFEWATEYSKKVNEVCELFLQPEWSREKEMMPPIVEFIKENPEWKISLQIHKYMNIP